MEKILVIEDEDVQRGFIVRALREAGYTCLDAADGDAGIALARAQLPDLVISDVNLGTTDGLAVLEALRSTAATNAIPVILMTGGENRDKLRFGMEHGADDYLPKPFDHATLLGAVRARLDRRQAVERHGQQYEARLLDILSATPDLVAIADAVTGRLVFMNHSGRKLFGLRADEDISGWHLADFYPESQKKSLRDDWIVKARQQGVWLGEAVCCVS